MTRILLVEDEPVLAEAAAFALRREGLEVVHAATLAAARAELVRPADLLVLDIGLPDGSGLDFCRELRRSSAVPLLFLTARSDEIDRIVGLELGADDYISKPFSPRELAARVKAVLRRSAAPALRAPLSGLVLDEAGRRALWRGRVIELPRLQYRILALLASRPGRVWSRDELLDACWEEPDERFDRAVDSQVRHLRAALRAVDPDLDPIRTVRGEGYAFEP